MTAYEKLRLFVTAKMREIRGMVYMAYIMAIVSMYIAKMLKSLLSIAIYLPDGMLKFIARDTCNTTDGKQIIVQQAVNETGCITNKLRLFMQMYWKNATDTLERRSGFRVEDYTREFLCKTLAVVYQHIDQQGERQTHSMQYKDAAQSVDQQQPTPTEYIDFDGRQIKLNEWSAADDEHLRQLCGAQ
jgi:hypothetical protein